MDWLLLLCILVVLFYLGSRPGAHRSPRAGGQARETPRPHAKDQVRKTPRPHVDRRVPRHSQQYTDYMHSPEWSLVRAHILRRAGYRCEFCKAHGRLQVHHLTYRHLGHERPWELVALCKQCHDEADRLRRTRRRV